MSSTRLVPRFSTSLAPSFRDRLPNREGYQNVGKHPDEELPDELDDKVEEKELDAESVDAKGVEEGETGEKVVDEGEVTEDETDEQELHWNRLDEEELDEEELDEQMLCGEDPGEEALDKKGLDREAREKEGLDGRDLDMKEVHGEELDGEDPEEEDLEEEDFDGGDLDEEGLYGEGLDGELEKELDRVRKRIASYCSVDGIGQFNRGDENAMGEVRRRSRFRRLKDMGFTPPTFNPFSYLKKGGLLFHGRRDSKDPKLTDRSSSGGYTGKASPMTEEEQLPTAFSRNILPDSDKDIQDIQDSNALERDEGATQSEDDLNKDILAMGRSRRPEPQMDRENDEVAERSDSGVKERNSKKGTFTKELEGFEWKSFMDELNKDSSWTSRTMTPATTPTCSASSILDSETEIKTFEKAEESTQKSQVRSSRRTSKNRRTPEEREDPTFWGMNSYESSYSMARSQADTPQLRRTMSDESDYRSSSSCGVRAVENQTVHKQVTLKGILRSKSEGSNDPSRRTSRSSGPRVRFAELDSVVEYWTDDDDIWNDDQGEEVMGIPDAMHNVMKLAGRCVKRPKSFWKGVKHLIKFLQDVDCVGANLYKGEGLRAAVFRYERIWLPMYCAYLKEAGKLKGHLSDKAERKISRLVRAAKEIARLREDEHLFHDMVPVPPIDVSWVWFLHRCSPKAYKADCERLFGVVLHMQRKHAFKYEASGSSARSPGTRKRWKEFVAAFALTRSRYCEYISRQRYLPRHLWSYKVYDDDEDRLVDLSTMPEKWKTRINYNLFVAARRHRGLLCSFVGEDFDKNCYSRNPVTFYRYITYLYLAGCHRSFVPMPDIEPLLYSHMAASRNFADDCLKIGGRLVDPDVLTVRRLIESDACIARLKDSERIWEEFLEDDLEYSLPHAFDICKAPSRSRAGYLEHCLAEQHERVYTPRTRRSSITRK